MFEGIIPGCPYQFTEQRMGLAKGSVSACVQWWSIFRNEDCGSKESNKKITGARNECPVDCLCYVNSLIICFARASSISLCLGTGCFLPVLGLL